MPEPLEKSNDIIKCPRKALVSYLWITMFTGFAAKYGADNLIAIMSNQGFLPVITYAIPVIFFVTLIRFSVGNILHLRKLEQKDSPSYIWVLDFLVIILEHILFLLLGAFTYGGNFRFFTLLLILFFIDSIWIATMPISGNKRPRIPWSWGTLNGITALILVGLVVAELHFEISYSEQTWVISAFFGWLMICAVVDFCLDHYDLWRIRERKKSSNQTT